MIAENKTTGQDCRRFLAAFFTKFPNKHLQVETGRILKKLLARAIPMPGKPAGWAAGIIYATANQGRKSCGIPGLLNQECEDFFDVSMGTIYRRAAQIMALLVG